MPESGIHHFADHTHKFHFEELQIYNKAHLGIWPRANNDGRNVSLFFKYMIGDRSGMVHIGDNQVVDLKRPEIDLPFSAQVYRGAFLGLATFTQIHGVEVIVRGVLGYIQNLTVHHGGDLWLNHGGRTGNQKTENRYEFDTVRVQDTGEIHCLTSPINDPDLVFKTRAVFIEGGGLVRGSRLIFVTENVTIDDGGSLIADGLGYNTSHGYQGNGLHGPINPGHGFDGNGASGAGHGGSGGRGSLTGGTPKTGFAYGDMYEPYIFGSAGG